MTDFSFGIYPGGLVGTESGLSGGYKNNPSNIQQALDNLQGHSNSFTVRAYKGYKAKDVLAFENPEEPAQYLKNGRKLDLVLCFQSEEEDMHDWKSFIVDNINQFGDQVASLQITEEANVNSPALDGYYKNARKALVEGVIVAKNEILKKGFSIKVGFNATPDFSPDKSFWKEIATLANAEFYNSLDYVGLDFFPDVFRQIVFDSNMDGLRASIKFLLNNFKNIDLQTAGISSEIEMHIAENGWATGIGRSYEKQSVILNEIIRTIYHCRDEFNITKYNLFDLRDADSGNDNLFYQFGIMRHDYTPKPAFEVFKLLINELTSGRPQ